MVGALPLPLPQRRRLRREPRLRELLAMRLGRGEELGLAVDVELVGRTRYLLEELRKVFIAAAQQVMAGVG